MNDKLQIDISEDEDVARAKAWWAENGKAIIGGIVLGTAVVLGYNYWKDREVNQAEAASAAYSQIDFDAEGADSAAEVKSVVDAYGGSTYAVLASLRLARQQAERGEFDAVADTLKNALALKQAEGALGQVIRLRLARALLGAGKTDEALSTLDSSGLDAETSLTLQVGELRGDIYFSQDKPDQAKSAYEASLAGEGVDATTRQRIELKLSQL